MNDKRRLKVHQLKSTLVHLLQVDFGIPAVIFLALTALVLLILA
ncbi:MAG: hypothetical protein AAFU57_04965 [Bacteroidota bacterium]